MTEVMQRYSIDTNEINEIQVKLKSVIHGDMPVLIRLSEVEFVYVMMETLLDEFHQTVGSLICHFYDGPPGSGPVLQDTGDRKAMALCGRGRSKGVVEWLRSSGDGRADQIRKRWGQQGLVFKAGPASKAGEKVMDWAEAEWKKEKGY